MASATRPPVSTSSAVAKRFQSTSSRIYLLARDADVNVEDRVYYERPLTSYKAENWGKNAAMKAITGRLSKKLWDQCVARITLTTAENAK